MRRLTFISMLVVGLLAVAAAPAGASKKQESIIQDDRMLMTDDAGQRDRILDEIKGLGADTIRVNAIWARIAPERESQTKPNFDATDPGAYPAANWAQLDALVQGATARGLGILITLTPPAPAWASTCGDRRTCNPNAEEFKNFATAVGRRYSGNYVPGGGGAGGGGGGGGGGGTPLPLPRTPAQPVIDQITGAQQQQTQAAQAGALPRVSRFSAVNEGNQGSWLTPQYTGSSKKPIRAAGRIYRGLLYAVMDGLAASGHGDDQLMWGDTAPIGRTGGALATRHNAPLDFYRDVLCIDSKGRSLTGTNARRQGCTGTFRALPGAVAHHPYTRGAFGSPSARAGRNDLPLASIRNLYRVLDQGAKRKRLPKKTPVFLTEYGVQTKPPDRFGVSPGTQARYLNLADWMAYRDSRIRSVSQYELHDPPEVDQFNTGLRYTNGNAKPSLAAYRLPIWVTRGRIWGQVRPGGDSATVQRRTSSKGQWKNYKTVKPNSQGYFELKVNRRGGQWRVVVGDNAGRTASGY
jgi:hypothetical protein